MKYLFRERNRKEIQNLPGREKKVGILSLLGGDLCVVCPNNLENSSSELLNKVGVSTFQLGKRDRDREREAQNK